MPDSRSLLDRMKDFFDYHLGGTVMNRPPRKDRDRHDQPASFIGDGGGSSGGFDDCGSGGDSGGGDCGGGDGGGGD